MHVSVVMAAVREAIVMHRQLITRTQYLAELNHRLTTHPGYVPGMKFIINNGGDPETAAGFDWIPPNGDVTPPLPFAEVAAAVHAIYRVQDL
jgi:hypothetical protein